MVGGGLGEAVAVGVLLGGGPEDAAGADRDPAAGEEVVNPDAAAEDGGGPLGEGGRPGGGSRLRFEGAAADEVGAGVLDAGLGEELADGGGAVVDRGRLLRTRR